MNAVWNSYGQLCGCPEIFKKSCKFFCRELDIRVSQVVDSDDLDARHLAAKRHPALQGVLGQGEDAAVRFQSVELLEVVLHLVAEEVRHLDHAVAFLRLRRGDNVLAL